MLKVILVLIVVVFIYFVSSISNLDQDSENMSFIYDCYQTGGVSVLKSFNGAYVECIRIDINAKP